MNTTVKHKEGKPINWDKPQLVINENNNIIVLTSGIHNQTMFEGTVMKHFNPYHKVGHYVNNWSKEFFKLFEGEIVITQ